MVCALFVGTVWLVITSAMGLNTSSTHTIIGAIVGFALVWAGKDGVIWAKHDSNNTFPPYKGVISIVLAWFIAPILTGAAAALFFFVVRFVVLRRKNAYKLSFWVLPPLVLITVFLCMYFVFTKGAKKALTKDDDNWSDAKAAWISAIIAGGVGLLVTIFVLPLLKYYTQKQFDSDGNPLPTAHPLPNVTMPDTDPENPKSMAQMAPGEPEYHAQNVTAPGSHVSGKSWLSRGWAMATYGMNVDIHKHVDRNATVKAIHDHAEVFEPRVEYAFRYLQVFSAICVIFAHGAGEVGYMAGPLATIWDVYKTGSLPKNVEPPVWIVLIGAVGLVIGLATYGYNVTRAMGVKLAKLTPTRGFCAELATAFVIMIASQYGLPTSSSQCITGAIVGVGLLEGVGGVNWGQFGKQFASWVATLAVVGLCTAGLFAQGVYAPSAIQADEITKYEQGISNFTGTVFKNFNTTLQEYRVAAEANTLPQLSAAQWNALNVAINASSTQSKKLGDTSKSPTVFADQALELLFKSQALVQQNTIVTLGQTRIFNGSQVCSSSDTAEIEANVTVACEAPVLLGKNVATSYP
eukprot:SM000094S24673  [mRNA]  locus=s94:4045:7180:- [translate_table: standard]